MRLHARFAAALVALTALAGPTAPAANAAQPMTLTDLGSAFSPSLGLAVESPVSAPGSITLANATDVSHTYVLVDLVTGATVAPASIAPGMAHTYTNLRPGTVFSVEQVGGVSRALVST